VANTFNVCQTYQLLHIPQISFSEIYLLAGCVFYSVLNFWVAQIADNSHGCGKAFQLCSSRHKDSCSGAGFPWLRSYRHAICHRVHWHFNTIAPIATCYTRFIRHPAVSRGERFVLFNPHSVVFVTIYRTLIKEKNLYISNICLLFKCTTKSHAHVFVAYRFKHSNFDECFTFYFWGYQATLEST